MPQHQCPARSRPASRTGTHQCLAGFHAASRSATIRDTNLRRFAFSRPHRNTNLSLVACSKPRQDTNLFFFVPPATPGRQRAACLHSASCARTPMIAFLHSASLAGEPTLAFFHVASQTGTPILPQISSVKQGRDFILSFFIWPAMLGHRSLLFFIRPDKPGRRS